MPLTLDDRLLGEKDQYYASSSEDDLDGDDGRTELSNARPRLEKSCLTLDPVDPEDDNPFSYKRRQQKKHMSTHTGPKGVINDQKQYTREQLAAESILNNLDGDTVNAEDTFLEQYRQKRLLELQQQMTQQQISSDTTNSSELDRLNGFYDEISVAEYLQITDPETAESDPSSLKVLPGSIVLCHLYDDEEFMCDIVDDCLATLATRLKGQNTYFCKIRARDMGSSANFVGSAVPAIQCFSIPKTIATHSLGTVVKPEIIEFIGEDFTADDLYRFLRTNFDI